VCLSEIPLDQLDRIVTKRSQHGIGFRKSFLDEQGGVRVWYIDKDEPGGRAARTSISSAAERAEKAADATDPIFNLTLFVDPIGEYLYSCSFRVDSTERRASSLGTWSTSTRGPAYPCPYIDPFWPDHTFQAALANVAPPPAPTPPPLL
jgi:hypothetical protein